MISFNDIQYNTPIEVTKRSYTILSKYFSWVVAHRVVDNKYFIKVLFMKYVYAIRKYIIRK